MMECKDMVAPILILIGGILALVSVLPIISNFLPLATESAGGNSGYVNFWGTTVTIGSSTTTDTGLPSGWTLLGLPPILMFLIFAILGIIGIVIAVDGFVKFIPANKVAGMPFMGLIGIIVGIIDLIMVLLMYIGDATKSGNYGFTNAPSGSSLGLGYYFLLISVILLIIGGIVNFVIKPASAK